MIESYIKTQLKTNPMNEALNVFNEPLIVCGTSPMTGAYRDGCCNTGANDR